MFLDLYVVVWRTMQTMPRMDGWTLDAEANCRLGELMARAEAAAAAADATSAAASAAAVAVAARGGGGKSKDKRKRSVSRS